MSYYKKIVGNKIFLSPFDKTDIPILTKWMNDPIVASGWGNPYGLINEDKMYEQMQNNQKNGYCFSIITKEEEKLVGYCMIYNFDKVCRSASFGVIIGDEEERNRGYGRDAVNLILEFAFKTLNIHSVYLGVFDFNKVAVDLYTKIGFRVIGTKRENYFLNGKWHNEILMDMLAEEFVSDRFDLDE